MIALPAVASARDKRRNGRDQGGGGDEPFEIDQEREQRDERQYLADQPEGRLHHRDRAVGRFALDLLNQIVKLRSLEKDQVELIGLAHDQQLDAVGDLLLQQLLADVADGAQDVAGRGDGELQDDQEQHLWERGGTSARRHGRHDGVDEQLGDPHRGGGQAALEEVQDCQRQRQARVGVPDQTQHAPEAVPRGACVGEQRPCRKGRRARRRLWRR